MDQWGSIEGQIRDGRGDYMIVPGQHDQNGYQKPRRRENVCFNSRSMRPTGFTVMFRVDRLKGCTLAEFCEADQFQSYHRSARELRSCVHPDCGANGGYL